MTLRAEISIIDVATFFFFMIEIKIEFQQLPKQALLCSCRIHEKFWVGLVFD